MRLAIMIGSHHVLANDAEACTGAPSCVRVSSIDVFLLSEFSRFSCPATARLQSPSLQAVAQRAAMRAGSASSIRVGLEAPERTQPALC
jgi:hypothetical protein